MAGVPGPREVLLRARRLLGAPGGVLVAQICYLSARMVARLPPRPSEFRTGLAAVDTGLSQAGQGQGHGIELQGKLETRAVDGTEP